MKLALVGYGAMGRMVASRATARGHEVVCTVRASDRLDDATLAKQLARGDVVVDFSAPAAVVANARACAAARRPLVIGTTGWNNQLPEVQQIIETAGLTCVFGANFSIGVNLFYRIVRQSAELLAATGQYEAFVEEQHHSRKKDSPSGTALKIKSIVDAATDGSVSVAATRAGHITGTHRVGFDSSVDQILLTHTARSREGFADGSVLAAEWAAKAGRGGVHEFDAVLDSLLAGK